MTTVKFVTAEMCVIITVKLDFFFLVFTGIIFGVLFILISLILLFLCQRIRIAIQLIKEGSR